MGSLRAAVERDQADWYFVEFWKDGQLVRRVSMSAVELMLFHQGYGVYFEWEDKDDRNTTRLLNDTKRSQNMWGPDGGIQALALELPDAVVKELPKSEFPEFPLQIVSTTKLADIYAKVTLPEDKDDET